MIQRRPLDINVETYSFCPMKCKFCCNRLFKRDKILMSNELFEKIVKEYCEIWGGGTIGIGSMQSDFLTDPKLIERIDILNKYKDKLYIHSTTPLISCKKYTDDDLIKILRTFDYLEISVEGHDKDSYELMSGVNGFEIFQEQIVRVYDMVRKNNLSIAVDLSFRTYDERELRNSKFFNDIKDYFSVKEIKTSYFSWFNSIKQEDLPSGAILIEPDNTNKRQDCIVPYATLAVQASGKVVGCGCIDWLDKYIIGDCNNENLDFIWSGEKALKFRKAFQNANIPSICKNCGLYISTKKCLKRFELLNYNSHQGLYYNVDSKRSAR